MGSLCLLLNRRSFLHGLLVAFGLCSCKTAREPAKRGFVPLRERVIVSYDDIVDNDGAYEFEAWLTPASGSDKLLDGILLENEEGLAAYSTYCPHEACVLKMERDSAKLKSVAEPDAELPSHPVLYCACHFSIFDTRSSGRHISGPAERGLYRFLFERKDGAVHVTHVEASILKLYG